jgi:hypothetical protein
MRLFLILIASVALQGCVARMAANVVTAPIRMKPTSNAVAKRVRPKNGLRRNGARQREMRGAID